MVCGLFSFRVRLVRECLIDYLNGKHLNPEEVYKTIIGVVSSYQLTLEEVLEIIDNMEEDPLCLPYIPRTEKTRKLEQLKKLLQNVTLG